MPENFSDYIASGTLLVAIVAAYFAWRQIKGGPPKTKNTITHGHRNQQKGGGKTTENRIDHGDDNSQQG